MDGAIVLKFKHVFGNSNIQFSYSNIQLGNSSIQLFISVIQTFNSIEYLNCRIESLNGIDLIHKWRPIYNSFVEVQISLPSLDTIQ